MISSSWKETWPKKSYKTAMISGVITLGVISAFLHYFFQLIEAREGMKVDDLILAILPAKDCSEAIFIFIWSCVALATYRFVRNPMLFITFLWAYIALCLTRIITISLVPLDAPLGLIPLRDPLSNYLYGQVFITKDLFYSGHTATLFLIFLSLERKVDRLFVLLSTGIVGVLLLFQHVHYTMDVLAAPFFAYLNYFCGKSLLKTTSLYRETASVMAPEKIMEEREP